MRTIALFILSKLLLVIMLVAWVDVSLQLLIWFLLSGGSQLLPCRSVT